MKLRLAVLAVCLGAASLPADAALAHVQVRPTQAAPGDTVLWTVLVPSEEDSGTTKVELAVPPDVLPVSFEDSPAWKRKVNENPNGSVKSITWTSRGTAPDGLATFRFLASTPERPGTLSWKALQTYKDGDIVRWIGAPNAEFPASVTTLAASAPRENAGGEGKAAPQTPATATPEPAAASSSDDDSNADWFARVLGIAAILVGVAVLVVLLQRDRRTKES